MWYLVLCNIPVNGEVRLIFPNDYQTNSLVKGREVHRIPDVDLGHRFRFYINAPFGKERLYAFASTWPLDEFTEVIRKQNGQVGSVKDMVKGLEETVKGFGVKPSGPPLDSEIPLKFAHDWCITTSVEGK